MDNVKVNKLLNEKYNLISDIVKKYEYSEELHCMLTFTYVAFCMQHGLKDCDYVMYDLIDKVKVIYNSGTINDVSIKYGFGQIPDGAAAVTMFTPNLKVFDNPELKQNPQTILMGTHLDKQYISTNALKMECLIHEIRHAVMGYYNTNILLDENTYYMRSGLHETYCTKKIKSENEIETKESGITLDEVLNTYITEILLSKIMNLKKYQINNQNLRKYLNTLRTSQSDGRYRVIGYEKEVRLMYPLLLNNTFVNLCDEHQFNGDLSQVKDFINNNSTYTDYCNFCNLLDIAKSLNNQYIHMTQVNEIDEIWIYDKYIPTINELKKIILDLNENINKKILIKS